ncbi:hypothetical protein [Streptomyces sp. DSM 40907]|uniref:hypothetical protein n=1 Tax=Streptomyces kutzneri TaxID=3051179 RepID=UPI0028D414E7|nr:hypothetical protein [Streptomyces sp. DSM 40907]
MSSASRHPLLDTPSSIVTHRNERGNRKAGMRTGFAIRIAGHRAVQHAVSVLLAICGSVLDGRAVRYRG